MSSIRPLPEAVHSSVRSGIILFDLTRVVEELVLNSIDAGATKVSVAVGVGTCYIKVADNGYGITRDGLVLLGERYATSKCDQLADLDSVSGSFGFRGEALGSISDISLLEVVTKAHGMPNGYRKVIKGCKCLYLGIDNDRRDAGTTVSVRDLFYNQPVRRKHLLSSPQRVLHSVKDCILKIALVHLKISFKVTDMESGDELLSTHASSSAMPLLTRCFGIEASNSLQEVGASDSVLTLSGYISNPSETSSMKAFQYFYINSRYISKGPIHRLLNQLAATFSSSDPMKSSIGSQNGKRSRFQTYPTYIMNLNCPRTHCDLTFEPSKTTVVFKDWDPVLDFLRKAITRIWSRKISYDSLSHGVDKSAIEGIWKEANNFLSSREDLSPTCRISKKGRVARCRQASLGLSSSQPEMLREESKHISTWTENRSSGKMSPRTAFQFEEQSTGMGFACQTSYSPKSSDGSLAQYKNTSLGPGWEDTFLECDSNKTKGLAVTKLSADCFGTLNDVEKVDEDLKKPFLGSCSSRTHLLHDGACFACDEGSRKKWLHSDDSIGIVEVDHVSQDAEPWQDRVTYVSSSPRSISRHEIHTGSGFFSRDPLDSFSSAGDCCAGESGFWPGSISPIPKFFCSPRSFNSDWSSFAPPPVFIDKMQDAESFIDEDEFKKWLKYHKYSGFDHSKDGKWEDDIFSFASMRISSAQEPCSISRYANASIALNGHGSCKGDAREFHEDSTLFTEGYNTLLDETEWGRLKPFDEDDSCIRAPASHHLMSLTNIDDEKTRRYHTRFLEKMYACEMRPRRSHSSPPIYKRKKKFFTLNFWPTSKTEKSHIKTSCETPASQEASDRKHKQESSGVDFKSSEEGLANESLSVARKKLKRTPDVAEIQNCEMQDQYLDTYNTYSDFTLKNSEGILDFGPKWRNSCPSIASGEKSKNLQSQDSILDISSLTLHLSGDSLVPKSICKNFLEDAKVLQQVDRKFIPVVAGRTLAIIDQHAADERIRLEELRQKVLSGEMRTVTYLASEQELVFPEIGYQLLHNYAEQIQKWGWICNCHSETSTSFKKTLNVLHSQPSVVTLLAVPCILGVNLTDVDLLEFLQQLADTDGSSGIPPAVLRVLNFKSCRGAIMFGDKLLPSECCLIVEELKRTSLCFQCAHGRPTTVPLVNLELLHKQTDKLKFLSGSSAELWHGLRRHRPSLERAACRLNSEGDH